MMNPSNNQSDDDTVNEIEKTRSVIVALRALKRKGSDDEISHSRFEETDSDVSATCNESTKDKKTCCWLSDCIDDLSGLTFTQKMHHVLRNKDVTGIISWLPSGRSFVIHDTKKFASEIIPKYFGKNVAYTSFTRRLARWGWRNIAKSTYYNSNFHRDDPEKCLLMTYSIKIDNAPTYTHAKKYSKKCKPTDNELPIQEPESSISHRNSYERHSVVNYSEVAAPESSSTHRMVQTPNQNPPFSIPLFYAPLLPYQLSNAAMGMRSATNCRIGYPHAALTSNTPFQHLNHMGLHQQRFVNNLDEARQQSEMGQWRQLLATRAVMQAAAPVRNQALSGVDGAAHQEASQSPSDNERQLQRRSNPLRKAHTDDEGKFIGS